MVWLRNILGVNLKEIEGKKDGNNMQAQRET
jgi:hypothetical protein